MSICREQIFKNIESCKIYHEHHKSKLFELLNKEAEEKNEWDKNKE